MTLLGIVNHQVEQDGQFLLVVGDQRMARRKPDMFRLFQDGIRRLELEGGTVMACDDCTQMAIAAQYLPKLAGQARRPASARYAS